MLAETAHTPLASQLIFEAPHHPNHHPASLSPAQLHGHMSLSLSGVLNCLPLESKSEYIDAAIASPASPLYPSTVSRYLSTSSLMKNVEYSAHFHRPLGRWICPQPQALNDLPLSCGVEYRKQIMPKNAKSSLLSVRQYGTVCLSLSDQLRLLLALSAS